MLCLAGWDGRSVEATDGSVKHFGIWLECEEQCSTGGLSTPNSCRLHGVIA